MYIRIICLLLSMAFTVFSAAQVKIGGAAGAPHSSALLELESSSRGLLIPRLDSSQQAAISSPANGLLVYNTTRRSLEYYDTLTSAWQKVVTNKNLLGNQQLDSLHWITDTASKRVFLRRGLLRGDSIFYDYGTGKFVFADRVQYLNSLGQSFPATNFAARYYFKSTASLRSDTVSSPVTYAAGYFIMEGDESKVRLNGFTGLQTVAIANRNNSRTLNRVVGAAFNGLQGSADTVQALRGSESLATHSGSGFVNNMTGALNTVSITDTSRADIGIVYGTRVQVIKSSPQPYRAGTLYGINVAIFNTDTSAAPAVTNDSYGLLINSVLTSAPGRNYAIRTFTGANILGDSTTIGPGGRPRATLEVAGNGSMILPAGITSQRPLTGIAGMLRYNTQLSVLEHFDGSDWRNTVRYTASVDVPLISAGGGVNVVVAVPNAQTGAAVVVSPSAAAVLPSGLYIAWSRVSAAGFVEVRFENRSALSSIDPSPADYYFRVIN